MPPNNKQPTPGPAKVKQPTPAKGGNVGGALKYKVKLAGSEMLPVEVEVLDDKGSHMDEFTLDLKREQCTHAPVWCLGPTLFISIFARLAFLTLAPSWRSFDACSSKGARHQRLFQRTAGQVRAVVRGGKVGRAMA